MMSGALAECLALRGLVMSGCHVPLSEQDLYTKIKELEIKNDDLKTKVEILKEMMRDIISEI